MSVTQGAGVLTTLKNKMQSLRDELEKYKDLYEEKCIEIEEEKAKRAEVGVSKNSITHTFTVKNWVVGLKLRYMYCPVNALVYILCFAETPHITVLVKD